MDKPAERCETCRWWSDYTDRVHVRISNTRNTNFARQIIEVRSCRHEPPPNADKQWDRIYTDEVYVCSAWSARPK